MEPVPSTQSECMKSLYEAWTKKSKDRTTDGFSLALWNFLSTYISKPKKNPRGEISFLSINYF